MPTQAHQPIVLIKQLYNGSTFLLSKYSEVNHHPSLSLSFFFFFWRERGNITLDDKMGHFLSQVVRTMNLSVQPIDLSAWPKCSTKLLPMHRSIWISLMMWWNCTWADWVKLKASQAQLWRVRHLPFCPFL